MAKVYFIAKYMDVHELPNILLSLVGVEARVAAILCQFSALGRKMLADVR